MDYFCEKCLKMHRSDELCDHLKQQIKNDPKLISEAGNFTNIAGQYNLITSQNLNSLSQKINNTIGTNLSYEGTHQFTRDIQVFKRLNEEAFSKCQVFSSPQAAQNYLINNDKAKFGGKLAGYAQEVDWQRYKDGQISSIYEKSTLLNKNSQGIDGITVNRFNGETITRTTIKAAQSKESVSTNIKDVIEALEKGTLKPDDTLVGIDGTKEALLKALENKIKDARSEGNEEYAKILEKAKNLLKVEVLNDQNCVSESKERLLNKIQSGKAVTEITTKDVLDNMKNGAIIGAAVSLTISCITTYLRYKNGEISQQEAFTNVAEDTTKGTIIGGNMASLTLFLPAGAIGFCGGFAVGIYLNSALTNILDEIYGKGVYREILYADGFIMGTSKNMLAMLNEFKADRVKVRTELEQISTKQRQVEEKLFEIEKIWEE